MHRPRALAGGRTRQVQLGQAERARVQVVTDRLVTEGMLASANESATLRYLIELGLQVEADAHGREQES